MDGNKWSKEFLVQTDMLNVVCKQELYIIIGHRYKSNYLRLLYFVINSYHFQTEGLIVIVMYLVIPLFCPHDFSEITRKIFLKFSEMIMNTNISRRFFFFIFFQNLLPVVVSCSPTKSDLTND